MKSINPTKDFGAPDRLGAHLFKVEIPSKLNASVIITEDFGIRTRDCHHVQTVQRVVLERKAWRSISRILQDSFNERLKQANVKTQRWHTGTNLVDRLLGKELCLLAWAAETANEQDIQVICRTWTQLRPEERWWLYSMTVAVAGQRQDTQRGWRRALYLMLSDDPAVTRTTTSIPTKSPTRRPLRSKAKKDLYSLPLCETNP